MPAPATSPRPTPRPNDLGQGEEGDNNNSTANASERPLTDEELIELGVNPHVLQDTARGTFAKVLEQTDDAALRGMGSVLKAGGAPMKAASLVTKANEVFDIDFDPDYPGTLGLATITFNEKAAAKVIASTGLAFGSLGISEVMTIEGQSAGDHAADMLNDQIDSIGGQIGSTGANYMDNIIDGFLNSPQRSRPVILDLDGDGLEFTSGNASSFDVDGDGYVENTAWMNPDDGFLVVDLDANGKIGKGDGEIDQAREIAFSLWNGGEGTDLEAVANATGKDGEKLFDTNGDGILSAKDDAWDSFKVWQDRNLNGEVDRKELKHLADLGISEISLRYDSGADYDDESDDYSIFGNSVHGVASFVQDGKEKAGAVGDISLAYHDNGQKVVDSKEGFDILHEDGTKWSYIEQEESSRKTHFDLEKLDRQGIAANARDNVVDGRGRDMDLFVDGGRGDDRIFGGKQDDILDGGEGADTLRGGEGDDTYLYEAGDGATIIDESLFSVGSGDSKKVRDDSESFSSEWYHQGGKGGFGSGKWILDTNKDEKVSSVDTGDDTLVLGEGIGISDLTLESSREASGEDTGSIFRDHGGFFADGGQLAGDFRMEVRTPDGEKTGDEIEIVNWGAFDVERLVFFGGYSVDIGRSHADSTADKGGEALIGVTGSGSDERLRHESSFLESIPEEQRKDYEDDIQSSSNRVWISALGGDDTLVGGRRDDLLNGGMGDDTMTGGPDGEDRFIFAEGNGKDRITDFEAGSDKILFDISDLSYTDLDIDQAGKAARVTYDKGHRIDLADVKASDLSESDFVFL